jgi:hypothetical protein
MYRKNHNISGKFGNCRNMYSMELLVSYDAGQGATRANVAPSSFWSLEL